MRPLGDDADVVLGINWAMLADGFCNHASGWINVGRLAVRIQAVESGGERDEKAIPAR